MTISGICLGAVFYVATAQLVWKVVPDFPLPQSPVEGLEPFRIANVYGLFERMTHQRLEIEFQGSADGKTWTPYPFRYKPQDPAKAPGIYAPYQPRFEWNLWFASLGSLAAVQIRTVDRGAPPAKLARRTGTLCGQSISLLSAEGSSLRDLSILVHGFEDQARAETLVAARVARRICSSARNAAGRQARATGYPAGQPSRTLAACPGPRASSRFTKHLLPRSPKSASLC